MSRQQWFIRFGAVVILWQALGAWGLAQFKVERLANGLSQPLYVTSAPGDDDRLFVLEKSGHIEIISRETGQKESTPFLNISGEISTNSERGLLGIAFHPNYQQNGQFFVNVTNPSGTTEIRRYEVSDNPNLADQASMMRLLSIPQPFPNHNGGWIDFGPDGFLYIATGDGGSGNDPVNAGQRLDTLLGKMVRIDVDGEPQDDQNYRIPSSNPFAGDPSVLDEIWSYGLRNPWRNSFDRLTGDLYIADVGQNSREEINFQHAQSPGGENYGWRLREGTITTPTGGVGGTLPGATDPVYDYLHGSGSDRGNSVTGGYVYRGPIPDLFGKYIFADFDTDQIWAIEVDREQQEMVDDSFSNLTSSFQPDAGNIRSISSFGEDNDGNLYVVDIGGEVFSVLPDFLIGDADRDGDIDSFDRTNFAANFTGPLAFGVGDATFREGDVDNDGDVDTLDATILLQNWTGAREPQAGIDGAAGVDHLAGVVAPEPAAPTMMLVGLGLLLAIRRHLQGRRS